MKKEILKKFKCVISFSNSKSESVYKAVCYLDSKGIKKYRLVVSSRIYDGNGILEISSVNIVYCENFDSLMEQYDYFYMLSSKNSFTSSLVVMK